MSSGLGWKYPFSALQTLLIIVVVIVLMAAMNFSLGVIFSESTIIKNCVKASGATKAECVRKLNELQGKE